MAPYGFRSRSALSLNNDESAVITHTVHSMKNGRSDAATA